jgi:hypothetical protein
VELLLQRAIGLLHHHSIRCPHENEAFKNLPKRHSFSDVLNNDKILISLSEDDDLHGAQYGNDIAITKE